MMGKRCQGSFDNVIISHFMRCLVLAALWQGTGVGGLWAVLYVNINSAP